jgi:magnesium chelatase family protein
VDAVVVDVEVDMAFGSRSSPSGLPDNAVKESMSGSSPRSRTARTSCRRRRSPSTCAGRHPQGRHGLRPSHRARRPPAAQIVEAEALQQHLFAGELALDGSIKPIRGALPLAVAARDAGLKGVFVPKENAREALGVEGIDVSSGDHLRELVEAIDSEQQITPYPREAGRGRPARRRHGGLHRRARARRRQAGDGDRPRPGATTR